jgi:hypothetical protein
MRLRLPRSPSCKHSRLAPPAPHIPPLPLQWVSDHRRELLLGSSHLSDLIIRTKPFRPQHKPNDNHHGGVMT